MDVQIFSNTIWSSCIVNSRKAEKQNQGGEILERVYDARHRVLGYYNENVIYDDFYRVAGYANGNVIYDRNYRPLAYVNNGYVYGMNDEPIGYYNDFDLYDMEGNYLGYGNSGFGGLLGAILILLLFRRLFRSPFGVF